jgi:hypothetical protein
LLVVRADGPKTVREFIANAKAQPGKLNYGAGIITTRLAAHLFNQTAGIDAVFVQYKGAAGVALKIITHHAILGNSPALMCAHDFFGPDHILFGTDMPFDPQLGAYGPRKTIEAVERMAIPDADKRKIFAENTRKLLRLAM